MDALVGGKRRSVVFAAVAMLIGIVTAACFADPDARRDGAAVSTETDAVVETAVATPAVTTTTVAAALTTTTVAAATSTIPAPTVG